MDDGLSNKHPGKVLSTVEGLLAGCGWKPTVHVGIHGSRKIQFKDSFLFPSGFLTLNFRHRVVIWSNRNKREIVMWWLSGVSSLMSTGYLKGPILWSFQRSIVSLCDELTCEWRSESAERITFRWQVCILILPLPFAGRHLIAFKYLRLL